jgi:putative salt-induced outer membrane protein YdiY
MTYPVLQVAVRGAIISSMLLSFSAHADILVLKNGDRITGEIKQIWDGEISIEPQYSDEFDVDVSAVEYIESDREFDLELDDGSQSLARLRGSDSKGNQIIEANGESTSIPLESLFELDEPEKDFDWESNIDFSASLNRGNTDSSNSKLRADTVISIPNHRHLAEITFLREELIDVSTQERDLFRYNYNWLFRDPWFFSALLSFERDPIIELGGRTILSAGIGYDIWATPRRTLSVQLGAGAQSEELASVRSENAVVTWSLRYSQDFFKDDLELYHNHSIIPNISGRTNTSYKTTTGLRYEITDLLYANFSIDYDYETNPVDTAVSEDVAVLMGFGAEF